MANLAHDGTATKSVATIEYAKIDDPLITAYEGWKSFPFDEPLLGGL